MLIVLLAAMGGGAVALPEESPPAAMFWAQSIQGGEEEVGNIGRATLSGLTPQEGLVAGTSSPGDVAVDAHYVYWANYASGTIGRARIDGSEVNEQFIGAGEYPIGVTVGDGSIFWTNRTFLGEGGFIGRANLDGSSVNQRFIRTQGRAVALAVDSQHLYWTNEYWNHSHSAKGYAIGRASLDGTGIEEQFIRIVNSTDGVAVNSSFVFWTNVGEHALGRANLDGSGVAQRCITLRTSPLENVPEAVAVNGQHVYWTNYPADTIGRANLDGSEPAEHFLPINGVPAGIAVGDEGAAPSSMGPCPPPSKLPLLFGPTNPPFVNSYTKGWGEVAPAVISNGGASASGTIRKIHWISWGGKVAVGRGLNPIFRPHGGYYAEPGVIELRASRVKRCTHRGRPVYTRFTAREQVRPGGPMGKWFAWASNMCSALY